MLCRPASPNSSWAVTDIASQIRSAIQSILDGEGDGWQVGQFVLAMGIERWRGEGVESSAWVWAPPDQPEWMSCGLLESAREMMRETSDTD